MNDYKITEDIMSIESLQKNIDSYHELSPYDLSKEEKREKMLESMQLLTSYHSEHCEQYSNILRTLQYQPSQIKELEGIPFLPVSLFKNLKLKSILEKDIFKTMTSSGTSGQKLSNIFLDRKTSGNQQKALTKIVANFAGKARMPMLIIDSPSVLKDRRNFSARAAGILGFSIFGSKTAYALDDNMNINLDGIFDFLDKNKDRKILLFGFTFMVWKHFYLQLKKYNRLGEKRVDLSNAILIHGGGWKKLQSEYVTPETFSKALNEVCSIPQTQVHDYYGMIEQTGSIYMQCGQGHLHVSNYSDVIIRNSLDFSACSIGEKGIIQVLSVLPHSYPGHALLTEDEGMILGNDGCQCGRKGKYFKVLGRLQNAEIRGCSDTYAKQF
jgi:phenylacetate-coenzyme A ligase PaaK-like adenylate-forming protein